MMTSFYNLLKYAATGQASPSMTFFDRMRASTLMGGVVQTLTGIPPLSFKSDGSPLISWSMKGNGSQTGTPTPSAPIQPEFVGTKTANLFDTASVVTGRVNGTTGNIEYSSATTIHDASINSITFSTSAAWRGFTTDFIKTTSKLSGSIGNFVGGDGATLNTYQYAYAQDKSFLGFIAAGSNAPEGTQYIRVSFQCNVIVTNAVATNIMVNTGSTALPYEPFGWAEKITCAGQTVPVYLGTVQTVRRVKKLVLTGEETVNVYGSAPICFTAYRSDMAQNMRTNGFCTHFPAQYSPASSTVNAVTFGAYDKNIFFSFSSETAAALNIVASNTASFKAWLASEYAAGHPVTIWYVLATPQTGIVNEPLCKIGDYADELSSTDAAVTIPTAKGNNVLTIETELQPSKVSITGTIKE